MNIHVENPVESRKENSIAEIKLKELFDGLIMENVFALQERFTISRTLNLPIGVADFLLQENEHYYSYELQGGACLVARVTTEVDVQVCRLSRGPVIFCAQGARAITEIDDALALMKCLAQYATEDSLPDLSGMDDFMQNLALAQAQSTWSSEYLDIIIENCRQHHVALHHWEQLSALRDRPFHPLAKSKKGWSAENFRQYSSETSDGFGLTWLAVNNNYLVGNSQLKGMLIAEQLLTETEQARLRNACINIALDCTQYTLIPVHPWHFSAHLKKDFHPEINNGQIILVAESLGRFLPTASGRSLIPNHQSAVHAKLPLALLCLGALRILPSRYLFNGYQAQQMLVAIIARMPERGKINLCDESQWLAFLPENESELSNRSGFLSCLLRSYPEADDKAIIPMAALAVAAKGKVPAIEWLYHQHATDQSIAEFSLQTFTAIARLFCEFSFHCFSHGVMPEVHGQNILVTFNSISVEQLTLRDHDTLRIFPPWLQQQQIPLLDYQMDWATPNSLICLSPQQLLSYFLTLGVQVNLRAIADALSQAYGIPMAEFWRQLKFVIESLLNEMNLPVMSKAILRKEIIDSHLWPSRKILLPCLIRRTRMMGMPNAAGSVTNPFHCVEERGN